MAMANGTRTSLSAAPRRQGDQPIVGDWDGDGKADIGVYGQHTTADANSASTERGLPDANNDNPNNDGAQR